MRVVGALWLALGGAFSRTQLFRPLVSRGCGYSAGLCCGGFAAGARLGGCALWFSAWRLAFGLRGRVCPTGCRCGGFAAGRFEVAVPFRLRLGAWGVASRWPFDPLGAAGARCSRLCRLDFGRDMHRFGPPLCVGGTSYRSCGRAGRSGPGLQGLSCPARIISGRAGILRFPGFMDWPWMPVLRCALQYCAQTMSSSVISAGQTAHFPSPPPSPRGRGS